MIPIFSNKNRFLILKIKHNSNRDLYFIQIILLCFYYIQITLARSHYKKYSYKIRLM